MSDTQKCPTFLIDDRPADEDALVLISESLMPLPISLSLRKMAVKLLALKEVWECQNTDA